MFFKEIFSNIKILIDSWFFKGFYSQIVQLTLVLSGGQNVSGNLSLASTNPV
ncbi:hypothetical protein SAMN04488057_103351 [Cyclobacterium lianum]|uniref:Uncharacterized protein n=1 Tax=Cyclobacterium lianum TaxID=388280 RepID=A0A1M7LPC0_9BACT|nr:hypothetical protein SAMN04488057_103351 [Cyclobacterium lianum]